MFLAEQIDLVWFGLVFICTLFSGDVAAASSEGNGKLERI